MLTLLFFYTLLTTVSLERALDSYELDVGQPPSWMDENQKAAAAVDRWYVDKNTAKCKPFKYLGSLGNFNNFVSEAVCKYHLIFTPEEKSKACQQTMSPGICKVAEENQQQRWYYSKDSVQGSATNLCHMFKYTGCGGNANNFESETECKNACHNKENSQVAGDIAESALTKVPNEFDCLFAAEVDDHRPKMGVVLHKDKKRCVYAAVGRESKRGHFKELPTCVKTCITEYVAACNATGPFQVTPDVTVESENGLIEYFYFDKKQQACLPFISQVPTDPVKVDDGEKNIFSSVELCASFCPATSHLNDIKAVKACEQDKVGVAENDDKYNLTRYYYETNGAERGKCVKFNFNGKVMNLNNFKSMIACENICKKPLASAPIISVISANPISASVKTPNTVQATIRQVTNSGGTGGETPRLNGGIWNNIDIL